MTCFRHENAIATRTLKVPCAPNGLLPVCDECYKPENRQTVFETYFETHKDRVEAQRTAETVRKVSDN